ncbi:GntR family transcriptional regulator [Salinibacterium sp. TMP30]|uniref:GntR family transcriptional regulator n=1 Tax=Salinibacterium sp. TMP30 TaxID=3138237 RepID=UPI003139001F
MLIRVDTASDVPLFEQLSASIRQGVLEGRLSTNERLPSARELAESLGINMHTVLRAYQELRDEGFIELRRGRGAIVSDVSHSYEALTTAVTALVSEARTHNISLSALTALIREEYR